MSARRTKASRRAAFRAHCDRTTEPVYDAPPLRPFLSRCRPRCGGSEWLSCWCGMCGEEPCYGCVDCNGEPDADYDDADWGDDDGFTSADDVPWYAITATGREALVTLTEGDVS